MGKISKMPTKSVGRALKGGLESSGNCVHTLWEEDAPPVGALEVLTKSVSL